MYFGFPSDLSGTMNNINAPCVSLRWRHGDVMVMKSYLLTLPNAGSSAYVITQTATGTPFTIQITAAFLQTLATVEELRLSWTDRVVYVWSGRHHCGETDTRKRYFVCYYKKWLKLHHICKSSTGYNLTYYKSQTLSHILCPNCRVTWKLEMEIPETKTHNI